MKLERTAIDVQAEAVKAPDDRPQSERWIGAYGMPGGRDRRANGEKYDNGIIW